MAYVNCDVSTIWLRYAIFFLQICCLYALDDHKPVKPRDAFNSMKHYFLPSWSFAYGPSNIIEDISSSYSYVIMCLGGVPIKIMSQPNGPISILVISIFMPMILAYHS